jgi:hypothetical protein
MSGTAATNDSGTGGYILDRPYPATLSGAEMTAVLQVMVAQLAGLPPHLVRPRWQPVPPTQPAVDETWAAVGVTQVEADEYPYFAHDGVTRLPGMPGPGVDHMQRHATVTVMVSFYGPEAEDAAASIRDALYVMQNMEPLGAINAKLLAVHDIQRAPELINQQFIDRVDVIIELRRQIERTYPIMNIESAEVRLITEHGETDVEVLPPP